MAVTAKTSALPLHPEESSFPLSLKTHLPKILNFSFHHLHSRQISSRQRTHELSVLNSSSDVDDATSPVVYLLHICSRGQLEQALDYLDSMHEIQVPADEEAFVSLVQLCEWKRSVDGGFRVYKHVSNAMASLSIRLGNALLSMFVRFGNLADAWYVFGKMPARNLFSWNVLIGGYAKSGFFDEALNLYHRMLWAEVRPDVYTFPCVLRTCGALRDLVSGKEVHVHVFRYGFESDIDVLNSLITMYMKCGEVYCARKLFDKMLRRDRISWNALISGYFENEECLEGLRMFFSMREQSIDPDSVTMTSVISACELLSDVRLGRGIHAYAVKMEFCPFVSVCNSLIKMYLSVGELAEGTKMFSRTESKDLVSWTSIISGYSNNGLPHKSIETYREMEAEGVSPDEITVASVLSACASLRLLDLGIKLHELAKSTGLISSILVANALIDMYSKCAQVDMSLEVFHQIPNKDLISWTSIMVGLRINNRSIEALSFFLKMKCKPNFITLVSILSTCARVGALMHGKEVHAYALRTGVASNDFLPNAILDMYMRCGRIKSMWNQFNMQKRDIASWNILLMFYAENGLGEPAVGLFHRLENSDVKPDEITFISLLRACSRSGMVAEGFKYFKEMKNTYGINPNLKHFACIVDLLGRVGQLEDAYNFIKKMPMKPDAAIWGALLNACRIHRQVELGELAAQHIFEMDTESVGYYILLCNFYAANGKWDEVASVRKMMKEKGLTVDPGCSWVEVEGTIHAFLSGDEFHPQIDQISAVLQGFYEKMEAIGCSGSGSSSMGRVETSKDEIFCGHSERLAVAFGLINTAPGMRIWVTKNLYMCGSCHNVISFISKVVRREICVRDTEQFHHFKDGACSCRN